MDFTFVTSRLATGAAIGSADDVAVLVAAGITHVVDCRAEFDDGQLLAGSGLQYLHAGVDDDGQPKPPDWFGAILEFALPALATPHHKVYGHCAAGVNRGPSAVYAILRAVSGLDATTALGLIHTARPVTLGGVRYAPDADRALPLLGF